MILTNNSHRFMIITDEKLKIDHLNVVDIDLKNKLIFGKYPFNYANNDCNVIVVTDSVYKHIMIEIEDRL